MERGFTFTEGEYYHIYSRGVEKRRIFQDEADYVRFQHLLYLANGTKPIVFKLIQGLPLDFDRGDIQAALVAYSLMPNHFHLLVREDNAGGTSKFMSKLGTSYSMYFNTKYQRSGALLSHPYRAKHINSDEYFRWVISYLHTNPAELIRGPEVAGSWRAEDIAAFRKYPFSSYPDFYDQERPLGKLIAKDSLPIEIAELEDLNHMLNIVREDSPFQGLPLE